MVIIGRVGDQKVGMKKRKTLQPISWSVSPAYLHY
jgi:hypothetical protein